MLDREIIPLHIAVIMDGNGRWAKKRGLPRVMGHRAGMKSVREVIKSCRELGIRYLTLYAFSSENWKRPKEEVETLMRFLNEYIDKELPSFIKNGIKLNFIGRMDGLPDFVRPRLKKATEETKDCGGMTLNVALNYSGRSEIIDAAKKFASQVKAGKRDIEDLDEGSFGGFLYTAGQPDPDLLIRTSGEMRISNFLLWQISYAELYVTPKLWPDFRKSDLISAVAEYQKRERRFGA
ncbi:MAG: di-trans,poly-cis-decaprenylcistransferase [Omnitrophica WOR_2 bacterium RIFCSPLOWO2_12_FULL_51_24]|nr:MAG: di-trans,poly-cis-decaprenylcistransferase [Omnitrophica WOR_2 bacterium RIFCSPHIGHO2_01_FULL_49_10]OGX33181.1 MAG: di-trans,poly-cis-decaprenylcistransferase [Omnitrophica WOR_2 bacterium RIFCSPLOWO2_02_FULL_50_19]OGX42006.1 MAG: di-trans,poly-cis-decaprenylcistransferase [Omnitrophica WOR_2 bacterium RIFCSPLOWO2_12_FULL_51_24]